MKEAMRLVNDYIVGCGFYAGLVGIQRGNLTKFKMQVAGDNGQGMVTQKEFNNQNKADKKLASKEELLKNLQQMRMLPSDEEETEKDKSKQ